ncbi:MAG: hypothetical protein Q8M16_13830, partial [Pirellulaceae bacterium]|nr:hypothetical protein [Pirellulaceae bacterium]
MSFDIERQLFRGYQFSRPKHDRPVGQSNREGEFQLQFSSSPAVYTVFAHRPGYAPSGTWASPNDPIQIRLRQGVSVQGTVVDQDNRPLKSAKVRLMAWFTYEANLASLAEMRKEVRMEGHLENDVIHLETKTAGNGTFRLDDLPKDRWVVLVVSADKSLTQCIVVDTGNDPTLEVGVSIPRFFDNGVIRLQPATSVELVAKAKDNGQPINLQAAYMSALKGMFSGRLDTEQVLKLEVRGNQTALPALPTGLHRFWLVPDPSFGYMGAVLDIAEDDSTTLIRKEIELVRGARVVGRVVDAVTEKPIPGVPIHYDPESLEEYAEIGADVAPTTSNKDGDFVMIVPPINGWLRQIGHVDGYRSIRFDLNDDVKSAAPSHRISPKLDTDTRVEFRLKPATRVKLQVMDTKGQPVAYARFVAKRRNSSSGWTTESGTADEQGRIELPNVFAAIFAEQPRNNRSANLPTEET